MINTAILIHKKREDLAELKREFPDAYFYICWQENADDSHVVQFKTPPYHEKNVLGSGIQRIFEDLPGYNIIVANENTTAEDIKTLDSQLKENSSIIIAANDENNIISKAKKRGVKIITGIFNAVHRQDAENVMSNVQAIPSDAVKYFIKLKGDTCNTLLSERFIIKDNDLAYKYTQIEGSVLSDAPETVFGYLKCVFIICFVVIKFMLSSVSAFLVDTSLAFLGYSLWSPLVVEFLKNLSFGVPSVLLNEAIISTGIARAFSSMYNYYINKKVVFAQTGNVSKLSTACKYFTLVLIIWIFNTIILKFAMTYLHIPFQIAKVLADIIMYFVSFIVQRDIVFIKRNK